jgi:hypothetical protein
MDDPGHGYVSFAGAPYPGGPVAAFAWRSAVPNHGCPESWRNQVKGDYYLLLGQSISAKTFPRERITAILCVTVVAWGCSMINQSPSWARRGITSNTRLR